MIRETAYDTIFQAQADFRLIMDCMANPGKIHQLSADIQAVEALLPASALVGLALMNADVSFYVGNGHQTAESYFVLNTSARPASAAQADFLFLGGQEDAASAILDAPEGELAYPEKGAFIILETMGVSNEPLPDALALVLRGPGVDGERQLFVQGLNGQVLEALNQKNQEYPLGIDTIFTDPAGHTLGLPRSIKITID
ncbi:MAG: phosphonate C-P lyase system protein PhnH [Bacteroidota bacterium]